MKEEEKEVKDEEESPVFEFKWLYQPVKLEEASCYVQILRSACDWSCGLNKVE